jgi:Na+(H+)/acetate symporter ActP
MEIILNITAFCLAVVAGMVVYIGYAIATDLYKEHRRTKLINKYLRMREDGSLEFRDEYK